MTERNSLTDWLDKVELAALEVQNAEDEEAIARILESLFDQKHHANIVYHLAFSQSRKTIEERWRTAPGIGTLRKESTTDLLLAVALNPLTPKTILFGYDMKSQAKLVMQNPMVPLYFETGSEELVFFLQNSYQPGGSFYFRKQQKWIEENYENDLLLDLLLAQVSRNQSPEEFFNMPRLTKKNARALELSSADRTRWFNSLKIWKLGLNKIQAEGKYSNSMANLVSSQIYTFITMNTAPNSRKKYHNRVQPLELLIARTFQIQSSSRFEDFLPYISFMKKVSDLMGQPMPWHPMADILEEK